MLEKYPYGFPVIRVNTDCNSNCALSLRFRNLVFHMCPGCLQPTIFRSHTHTHIHAHTHVAVQELKIICSKEYLVRERFEKLGRARTKKTNLQRGGSQIIRLLDYRSISTCCFLHLQACKFTINLLAPELFFFNFSTPVYKM